MKKVRYTIQITVDVLSGFSQGRHLFPLMEQRRPVEDVTSEMGFEGRVLLNKWRFKRKAL